MSPKKRRITNTKEAKTNVTSLAPQNNTTLKFDFSNENWLNTIKNKRFNNRLHSAEDFAKHITLIFYKIVPFVIKNWEWIKKNPRPGMGHHCHPVVADKLSMVKDIIMEINGDLDILDEDRNFWQLGLESSTRVIVYYLESQNTFVPLFIDYNHLIHPVREDRRNQVRFNDLDTNSYCPVTALVGLDI